jgi:ketosteroid isomerase-like protein
MNTNRVSLIAAIGAASWMLAACSGSEPPAVADDDCVVREITLPEDKTAELARLLDEFDPVALGKLLRDNARLLPPNVPAIEGREAILEHYKGSIAKELDYEVTPLTRVMVGNVGLAEGSYRVKNLVKGEYVEEGKYLTVWVYENGQWQIARMMTNTDYQVARTSISVETPADPGQ